MTTLSSPRSLLLLGLALALGLTRPAGAAFNNPLFAFDNIANKGPEALDKKLDELKSLGYAGLSWSGTDIAQIKKVMAAADERKLKLFALYVATPLAKDKLVLPDNFDALCAAVAPHDTIVWLHAPSKDFKPSDAAGDAIALPALRDAADRAAKHKVRVALYPHHGFWAQTVGDVLRLANAVDRPNFGISFNLCHALKTGDEARLLDLLTQAKPRLLLVTINGADAAIGPKAGWDKLIQPIGQGTFDLAPVLKHLRDQGFVGPIGFQGYAIKGERPDILRSSIEAWKKLLASL